MSLFPLRLKVLIPKLSCAASTTSLATSRSSIACRRGGPHCQPSRLAVLKYRKDRWNKRNEWKHGRSFLFFRSWLLIKAHITGCPLSEDSALTGRRCLPDAHDAVIISRGEACAVRRPGDREHFAAMIAVGQRGSPRRTLPYLYRLARVG